MPHLELRAAIWSYCSVTERASSRALACANRSNESRRHPTPTQSVTIQRALRLVGYDPGPADGAMGERTASALHKYSASKGHPLTDEGLRKRAAQLLMDAVEDSDDSADVGHPEVSPNASDSWDVILPKSAGLLALYSMTAITRTQLKQLSKL
ncbi:MAG: peptidoglycan-binding protein [Gemmatimonadaceae bacterium]